MSPTPRRPTFHTSKLKSGALEDEEEEARPARTIMVVVVVVVVDIPRKLLLLRREHTTTRSVRVARREPQVMQAPPVIKAALGQILRHVQVHQYRQMVAAPVL